MPARAPSAQRRTYLREALLLAGFLLIVVTGIVTVAAPELSKTPDDDRPTKLRASEPPPPADTKPSR